MKNKDYTIVLLLIIFLVALFVSSCNNKANKVVHVDNIQLYKGQLFYNDTLVLVKYNIDYRSILKNKEEIELIQRDGLYYLDRQ